MNFNTSLYSNALSGISEEFNVSKQVGRCGAMIFLVLYAFGCELWAPWSEELGRKPILQLSLFLVNIWQIPVGIAPDFATIMVGRALGGICTAGGSVTLGMIADLWEAEDQQYAVACVVFSSVGGSVLGPVVGGFVEAYLPWRWNIWIQLIFGVFVQIAHVVLVPETRTMIMLDRIAKERRKMGENIYGPNELVPFQDRFSTREILITWIRPFRMFLTEPIVLTLSLLSGFTDALIFIFIQSFGLVYAQWNFGPVTLGLSFLPIMVGYVFAWIIAIPVIKRNVRERLLKPNDERAQYESRLWWLLYTALCLPIGMIGFAWTSLPQCHWIGTMVFSAMIGIANFSIFMGTIDYMICAYGPYSASAAGGNGWSRDFLAGVLTVPATPFYETKNIKLLFDTQFYCVNFSKLLDIGGKYHLEYASTILCKLRHLAGCSNIFLTTYANISAVAISVVLVITVYVIYWYGPTLRKRSPFAQQLIDARVETHNRIIEQNPGSSMRESNQLARSQQSFRIRQTMGSRTGSFIGSCVNSRSNSRRNSLSC